MFCSKCGAQIPDHFPRHNQSGRCRNKRAGCRSSLFPEGLAVIFAPPEFVAAMGADAIVPITAYGNPAAAGIQGVYHPQDIDAIHNTGYINLFRGTPIVQIPQSFIDENNNTTWIDPQLAYVLPTGGEKVVKVVFEGNTQMYDFVNRDQSMEIHTYRKIGTAILAYHNWGIYKNSGITQTYDESLMYI
mgnify:CR=1 FL=1